MTRKEYMREYQKKWISNRRTEWIKANGPCQVCGSDQDLEVDHIDPATKSMHPARIWSRRQEIRDEELAKCQVLCESCHMAKTKVDLSKLNRRTHCFRGHLFTSETTYLTGVHQRCKICHNAAQDKRRRG